MVTKSQKTCPKCGQRVIWLRQKRDDAHPNGQLVHFGTLEVQCAGKRSG